MRYVLLLVAFSMGVSFRKRIGHRFRLMYRGQALVVGAPLAFLSGWSFVWRPTSVGVLFGLLSAELASIFAALWFVRRERLSPVTAVATTSNSGFWSTPIAGALFGAPGAAFAVVYDIVGAIRPFIIVRTLRRRAAATPSRRSGLVDYLPAAALFAGLVMQLIRSLPDELTKVIPWLALVLGGVGFFALGAAMPDRFPARADFAVAAPVLPFRYVLPFATLLVLSLAGIEVPDGSWVVALAPNAFLAIAMARLYGYDRERAAAVPLLTVPISAALLPLVAVLGHGWGAV